MDPEIKVTQVGQAQIVGTEPSLADRARALQQDAVNAVVRIRNEVLDMDKALKMAKGNREEAARVAVMVGAPKDQVAEAAGVSVSTVSNWLRGSDDGHEEAAPTA
jgi:transcriptional regulator with XRE-family HTH domain